MCVSWREDDLGRGEKGKQKMNTLRRRNTD